MLAVPWPQPTLVRHTFPATLRTNYWSTSSVLAPACIFAPRNAEEVAHAVSTLTSFDAQFAVKSGGGMPVDGAANINGGVVVSMANLTSIEVSEDASLIKFGAGCNWDSVYAALLPHNRTAVGGRMGLVGVAGFLLGGGVGFLGNQYGFAAASVVEHECVLANGTVLTATATNSHAPLHWALKGGGPSFCLVTSFTARTHPSGSAGRITGAHASYGPDQLPAFISALHAFALHGGSDPRGAVEPSIAWTPGSRPSALTTVVYDGADADPAVLRNWTGGGAGGPRPLEAQRPLLRETTMREYARSLYGGVETVPPFGLRARFVCVAVRAREGGAEALRLLVDDYFPALERELAGVANVSVNLVFQPWRADFVRAAEVDGGNPMGLVAERAPWIWVIQGYAWADEADDAVVERFYTNWTKTMDGVLEERGWRDGFVYMNDADAWQRVFEGYGEENVRRLKEVRRAYDPDQVFTTLMPGGFKVEHA
ncbi:putative FAD dependent oxidoreductase [Neofusicoccum parvum]|uniref:FAD dependent oxidoreductase n=1 Tax=Neofusicoccum parvum TaxID=310453 RepID=A0ACB5SHR4_9PEZI|nr:putative FAD dependent oxidoreductase [Neofusicoccum parvum]GME49444.1 putative FAD dependent oxidoreductase [Neofusicoccum parvum]